MKKIIPFAAICLAAASMLACTKQPVAVPEQTDAPVQTQAQALLEITEGVHKSEPGYEAIFNTHAIETEDLTVHMMNKVYDEAKLRTMFETVRDALDRAEAYTSKSPMPVTVYAVRRYGQDRPVSVGGSVFCTPEDIENGSFRGALLGAAYGLSVDWQREGLSDVVFSGEPDESGLKEFFDDPANELAASLSPLFMDAVLAGEETVVNVKKAAASLAAYAVASKGFDEFCASPDTAALLPDWMEHLGVSNAIELPECPADVADITVTHKEYGPVLTFGNFTVNVPAGSFVKTADELYRLACGISRSADMLMERFSEETPSLLPIIGERLENGVTVTLANFQTTASSAVAEKGAIVLTLAYNFPHELVHVLLNEAAPIVREKRWIAEALAEHFSLETAGKAFPQYDLQGGLESYREFFRELSETEETEDDLVFHRTVWSIYEHLRSEDVVKECRDDVDAYEYAYGIAKLLLPDLDRKQIRFKYDRSVAWGYHMLEGPKDERGNNLSYPEARAVFEYLSGRFGVEKLTRDQIESVAASESIGMSWHDIYAEAREYYKELYGKLAGTADNN